MTVCVAWSVFFVSGREVGGMLGARIAFSEGFGMVAAEAAGVVFLWRGVLLIDVLVDVCMYLVYMYW